MSTGDIKNNLRKLKKELLLVKYVKDFDIQSMSIGITNAFLPLLHHIVVDYSCELSWYLSLKGYEFLAKNDLRFVEILYKVLIEEFSMKPLLTKQQFFTVGFAEMKIIFVTKIINAFRMKHEGLVKKKRTRKPCKVPVNISNKQEILVKDPVCSSVLEPPKPSIDLCLTPVKNKFVVKQYNENINSENQKSSLENLENKPSHSLKVLEQGIASIVDHHYNKVKGNVLVEKYLLEYNQPSLIKLGALNNDIIHNLGKTENFVLNNEVVKNKDQMNVMQAKIDNLIHEVNKNKDQMINVQEKVNTSNKEVIKNKEQINEMKVKIETLETLLNSVFSVNHELQAKILLLETRIDVLESKYTVPSVDKHNTENNPNDFHKNQLDVIDDAEIKSNADDFTLLENVPNCFGCDSNKKIDENHEGLIKRLTSLNYSDSNYSNFDITKSPDYANAIENNFTEFESENYDVDSVNNSFMSCTTENTLKNLQKQLVETQKMFSKQHHQTTDLHQQYINY